MKRISKNEAGQPSGLREVSPGFGQASGFGPHLGCPEKGLHGLPCTKGKGKRIVTK